MLIGFLRWPSDGCLSHELRLVNRLAVGAFGMTSKVVVLCGVQTTVMETVFRR